MTKGYCIFTYDVNKNRYEKVITLASRGMANHLENLLENWYKTAEKFLSGNKTNL